MDDFEGRLASLEHQMEMARISEGVLRSTLTRALGFIVLHHGEHGRAFVEGLKVHDERLRDPQTDAGSARPDYEERYRAAIDQIADLALSASVVPLPGTAPRD
ncbi:hypothetical protein D3C75_927770 [compost metagenome]